MPIVATRQLENHLTVTITEDSCQTPNYFTAKSSFTNTRILLTQSFLQNLARQVTDSASKVKQEIMVYWVRFYFIAMVSLVSYLYK